MRRIIKGKNPFHPDRGHIHHRLRDLGHSPRTIALLVYAICAGFSLLSLILFRDSGGASGVVLVLAGGIAVVTVQRLRIPELLELGNIAQWGPARRRIVERNLRVREAVERLEKADSGEEILSALEHAFSDGEFCRLEMWLEPETGDCLTELDGVRGSEDGVFFRKDLKPRANGDEHGLWEVRLPLTRRGQGQFGRLSLFRELDGTRLYTDVSLVGRSLEPVLIDGLEACREDRQESGVEGTNGKGLGTLVKVVG
jgi:hypothetical protein